MPRPCRFCGARICYEHCRKTRDGKHIPDPDGISVPSGVQFVVDISCLKCGTSGSTRIDPDAIKWD